MSPTYAFGSPIPSPRLHEGLTVNPTTPAPAQEPTTTTEYGFRSPSGAIEWQDDDGDLHLSTGGYLYGVVDMRPAEVLAKFKSEAPSSRDALVSRTVTTSYGPVEAVVEPLPTAPGSIIRASTVSPMYGALGVVTLVRTSSSSHPWQVVPPHDHHGAGIRQGGVTEATVLFDAGAA